MFIQFLPVFDHFVPEDCRTFVIGDTIARDQSDSHGGELSGELSYSEVAGSVA